MRSVFSIALTFLFHTCIANIYLSNDSLPHNDSNIRHIIELRKLIESQQRSIDSFVDVKLKVGKLQSINSHRLMLAKAKWKVLSENLILGVNHHSDFQDFCNNLSAHLIKSDQTSTLIDLSSPVSGILGFKLDSVIEKELLKANIFTKRSAFDRFMGIAKNIVNSPVLTNIPGISNALSISNSIINVLNSVAMNEKNIDLDKIQNFKKGIEGYIKFYEELNTANQNYRSGLKGQELLLDTYQNKLIDEYILLGNHMNIKFSERDSSIKAGLYFQNVKSDFNQKIVELYFNQFDGREDYQLVVDSLPNLKLATLRIVEINNLSRRILEVYQNVLLVEELFLQANIKSIETAKKLNIIESRVIHGKTLTAEEVYQEITKKLQADFYKVKTSFELTNKIKERSKAPDLLQASLALL